MFSEYACNHQQSALHERRTSCDQAEIVYELFYGYGKRSVLLYFGGIIFLKVVDYHSPAWA